MDLGARPCQVFLLVTLPMIAQSLLSAWLLTFTLSLDDVVLSAFLSGPGATTMPLVIFSRARLGLNPSVNAVATIIVVLVAIGVVAASPSSPAPSAGAGPGDGGREPGAGDVSPLPAYLCLAPAWRSSAAMSASRRRWWRSFRSSCSPGCASRSPPWRWRPGCAVRPRRSRSTPRTHRLLFIESFFGNFLFSICMLSGVYRSSALAAGVIMAALPAVVALLSWILLGERPGWRVMLGVPCAIAGIALVALTRDADGELASGSLLGNLLLLGAVFCESLYVVLGKQLSGRIGPKRISALINLWGLALVTPLALWQPPGFRRKPSPRSRGSCSSSTRSPPAC